MTVSMMSTAVLGLERATRALERTAQRGSNPEQSVQTAVQNETDRVVAGASYRANAAVVRNADEMLGTLLDIVA